MSKHFKSNIVTISYHSINTYVVCAQKNRSHEYPQHTCWLRYNKMLSYYSICSGGLTWGSSKCQGTGIALMLHTFGIIKSYPKFIIFR